MKSIILLLVAFAAICYAKCDCDAADNSCISKCVVEANSCVTSCKGNIECYESCIDDKWPSANAAKAIPKATFKEVLAATSAATTTNLASATSSAMITSSTGSMTARPSATSTSQVSLGSTLKMPATVPILLFFMMLVLV
ncbi:hypothetical protein INT47_009123 [Mucor saturninus]|uniref:Uncharacterized protein n=1 Tax=Mucor saturninus TaxID=64648 RepID=A0A8H7RL14_9FUNG|nr:hypothetical protein INT47_009123 [Mucor saturninus]